ncbi:hypothetical protein [endosymbiont GvMRE of Glomus versiforme]|uniref:hypothetical protein n=1 Tax=endosymbiont GvMRE of Glomus versiforme TaxID=2039283 RepID=UPI000ECA2E22|nr:hypothetical protein [endosymbiont GvMRE of Glomus versiforme]RHZ35643.1 hypothetical protein GvMRE_IIg31 [endosymbiont GvMRE of Glomus versiforme]
MTKLFKLIDKNFSKVDNEWQWTYSCLFPFTFNKYPITEITITDHLWKKKGREEVTKELILSILRERLNNKIAKPSKYRGKRIVFIRQIILYARKNYRLIFWFKDQTTNHLWIRNCYPINYEEKP